jgi:hypothetical protein
MDERPTVGLVGCARWAARAAWTQHSRSPKRLPALGDALAAEPAGARSRRGPSGPFEGNLAQTSMVPGRPKAEQLLAR